MERLRQLWARISEQLGVLTVSQRLVIGLCAALVAVSLLWLMQWSTAPEMVPITTHEFSFEELRDAEDALRAAGIEFQVHGTRLLVRPADRHNAVRVSYDADALPDGSLYDLKAAITESDPFVSPEARRNAWTYATGNELAKIIITYPFVKKASVMINPVTKRRLGGVSDVPTASLSVTLTGGTEMGREKVEGFAKLIAGAVAGLQPHNVNVTDARTGRSYSVPHPNDAASFDVLSMVKRREDHYRGKILSKLADIPGLQVAVAVELDTSKRVTQNITHAKPEPKKETSDSTERSSGGQPSEAGVQANTGTALTGQGAGGTNTTEKTTTENFNPLVTQTEQIEQMPFAVKKVTASVGIPRSFVAGVYKARYPQKADEPKDDDPLFVGVRDEQVTRVKSSIERIVMARDPNDVIVDVYPDMDWSAGSGTWSSAPGAMTLANQGAESLDVIGLARTYVPQAGLGILAMMSLFMMLRVARKSERGGESDGSLQDGSADALADEPLLTVGPTTVGQAETSESLLAGKEVDPESLRYQELGAEVSKMVEGDPEGAANLIRRWVEAGD